MRLKFLEGPIQRQVQDKAEYRKPISVDELQDVIDAGMKQFRKEDPDLAAGITSMIVENVGQVYRANGEFTLEGLERFNDGNNIAQSGLAKVMDSRARDPEIQSRLRSAQLGTAALVKFLVAWVNDGRPDPMPEKRAQLSIAKIRDAIQAQGMKPEDQEYVEKLLAAFEAKNPGGTITMQQVASFHGQINEQQEAMKERIEARERAGLGDDRALSDAKHELVVQSLGAYRLSDFLTFSADQGELGNLAAQVQPGAARQLSDAF